MLRAVALPVGVRSEFTGMRTGPEDPPSPKRPQWVRRFPWKSCRSLVVCTGLFEAKMYRTNNEGWVFSGRTKLL